MRGTVLNGAPGGGPPGRLVSGVLRHDNMGARVPSGACGSPVLPGRRTRARLGARWTCNWDPRHSLSLTEERVLGGSMYIAPSASSGGGPPGGCGAVRAASEAGLWAEAAAQVQEAASDESSSRWGPGRGSTRGPLVGLLFVRCRWRCQRRHWFHFESVIFVVRLRVTASTSSSGGPPGGRREEFTTPTRVLRQRLTAP